MSIRLGMFLYACSKCGVAGVRSFGGVCPACAGEEAAKESLNKIKPARKSGRKRDARCVKCGSVDIHVRWHRNEDACTFEQRNYDRTSREGEHLHYHCRYCSYNWTGDTLDKEKGT